MKTLQSQVLVDGLIYPEGIRWHGGRIWFSDILASRVYALDPVTGQATVALQLNDRPSGLGFLPDGRLLVVSMGERKILRLDQGEARPVADLSGVCDLLNDMVTDAQGRAYVDGYFDFAQKRSGIVLVETNGAYRIVADDMRLPNGMAITPDGRTLLANDFLAHEILAFDIAADGGLSNRRVFADLDGDSPDGICLDAEGAAWVGVPLRGQFRRVLEGGEVTHQILCGERWGIAPVLGGADRASLYLCTAEVSIEAMRRLIRDPTGAQNECRGWIETARGAPSPGAGWP